jgi:uncharacterized membrane protein
MPVFHVSGKMQLRPISLIYSAFCAIAMCHITQATEVKFTKLISERIVVNAVAEKEDKLAGMSISTLSAIIADASGTHTPGELEEFKGSVITDIAPSGTHSVGFVSIAFDKNNPTMPSLQAYSLTNSKVELLPIPNSIASPWDDVRLKSRAEGISDDGSISVGYIEYGARFQAIRWKGGTPQILAFPSSEYISSVAYDVSADGSSIVGACSTKTGESVAVIWEGETLNILGEGIALKTSPNGEHTIGVIDRNDGKPTAVLYSGGQSITLESLEGFTGSKPHSISNSGDAVVGQGIAGRSPSATIWLRALGYEPLDLNEVFSEEMKREGIPHISSAKYISRDGNSIYVICDDFDFCVYKIEIPGGYFTNYQRTANKTE